MNGVCFFESVMVMELHVDGFYGTLEPPSQSEMVMASFLGWIGIMGLLEVG